MLISLVVNQGHHASTFRRTCFKFHKRPHQMDHNVYEFCMIFALQKLAQHIFVSDLATLSKYVQRTVSQRVLNLHDSSRPVHGTRTNHLEERTGQRRKPPTTHRCTDRSLFEQYPQSNQQSGTFTHTHTRSDLIKCEKPSRLIEYTIYIRNIFVIMWVNCVGNNLHTYRD